MKNSKNALAKLGVKSKNKKMLAQQNWAKLAKWINVKGLKVVLILEGDQNKTAKRLIKNLANWSSDSNIIRRVKMKKVISKKESSYFEPIISNLPQKGQLTIFENCWYQKSIENSQLGKWDTTLWNNFLEHENMLNQANYIIVKFALKNQESTSVSPIFEILKKTENIENPFSYFNCLEKKSEPFKLIQFLIDKVPHQDLTFPHSTIPFKMLRKRAHNLRWAQVHKNVIPLTTADSDFPIAPEISQAINDYSNARIFPYSPKEGLPEFKKAASKVLKNRKGIECTPELILPTNGTISSMHTIAKFALKPGDEAIIFDPVDFSFQKSIEAAGGKIVRIAINKKTGTFNTKEFINAISKKTKMICLCNPHNPMGKIFSRQELLFIGSLAVKHQLWIMNNEVWSDIIFPECQPINIASLHPEIAERTISIYSFSKAFGLAGLRIGFIATPSKLIFNKILQTSETYTNAHEVSTLSQVAATVAYEKCWYWVDSFLDHLTKVRDYCVERLNKIPGVECPTPKGTYLLFPNIKNFGLSSEEMALYLLENAKVAVIPGSVKWFGPGAEGHIRICFSTSMELMIEAMDRIEIALNKLFIESQLKMEEIYFKNFDPEKVIFQ
ncbi:MAG: pyridoxal phosphate-dependent aminotransferase [Saprospiraceae bacterium]